MGKHTPGPWVLDADEGGWTLLAPNNYHDVCSFDAGEADAHLIAAAPDLLNALRIAIADSCGGCGRETCVPCQTLASVEAPERLEQGR